MAEVITEMVLPGVYVAVNAEGLIRSGAVSVGNVGVVGTAIDGKNKAGKDYMSAYNVVSLSTFDEAKEAFGEVDDSCSLVRGLGLLFSNGAKTVYAVRVPSGKAGYEEGLRLLLTKDVHIVVTPGIDGPEIQSAMTAHCNEAEGNQQNRIGLVGCEIGDAVAIGDITGDVGTDDRIIYVAPGIKADKTELSGSYTACAVAGIISALPPHFSPTNKTLAIEGLSDEYSYSKLKELVNGRVLVLEKKNGYRIVKGITTDDGAWKQITTRRIVDYAKAGVRQGCLPYIGKLNNDRVRKAMKATIDGFLATMKQDEMLIGYTLDVSATRDDEIEGRCIVVMTLQPTFSIDYIKVIIYLD
ncbi:MAG: phage tail sheath C-terminal domain-containing protein [Candidatus Desantisbacteria bacterium]